MHIYRTRDASPVVPPGHFGNLQTADVVTSVDQGVSYKAQLSFCPPEGGGEMHHHDNEDQLFIVVDGELTFKTGEQEFTLEKNEAVLFHAGDPHYTINQSDEPSVSVVITSTSTA